MSSQTTKATLEALDRSDFVVTSIRTQNTLITGELSRAFLASLPPDADLPMPDWASLQEAHARCLEQSSQELRKADLEHR